MVLVQSLFAVFMVMVTASQSSPRMVGTVRMDLPNSFCLGPLPVAARALGVFYRHAGAERRMRPKRLQHCGPHKVSFLETIRGWGVQGGHFGVGWRAENWSRLVESLCDVRESTFFHSFRLVQFFIRVSRSP